jgi:hypothetical protein
MKCLHAKRSSDAFHSKPIYYAFLWIFSFTLLLIPVGIAGAETFVSGTISTDAIWLASGSPYTLTGDITVSAAASLTINSWVIVNMNGYNINVEGTFRATGTAFHLAKSETEGNLSMIIIKASGRANFDNITANGKDYIIVQAGATINVSAPVKKLIE